jgi:hypothetical protein
VVDVVSGVDGVSLRREVDADPRDAAGHRCVDDVGRVLVVPPRGAAARPPPGMVIGRDLRFVLRRLDVVPRRLEPQVLLFWGLNTQLVDNEALIPAPTLWGSRHSWGTLRYPEEST